MSMTAVNESATQIFYAIFEQYAIYEQHYCGGPSNNDVKWPLRERISARVSFILVHSERILICMCNQNKYRVELMCFMV